MCVCEDSEAEFADGRGRRPIELGEEPCFFKERAREFRGGETLVRSISEEVSEGGRGKEGSTLKDGARVRGWTFYDGDVRVDLLPPPRRERAKGPRRPP